MNPIIGKKVILFSLTPQDFDHFSSLLRGDKNGYMLKFCLKDMNDEESKNYLGALLVTKQLIPFTVITKEGKASRRGGYVYLSDLTPEAVNLSGIMDREFAVGLAKVMKKDKYTFSQDSVITLIDWLFNNIKTMQRIETNVVETNRLSLQLMKRCGFTEEGVLRQYVKIDDRRENVVVLSLLRSEWENGKTKISVGEHTDLSKAGCVVV
jgi:RimJ/RimL family protein N-acetyltransferase